MVKKIVLLKMLNFKRYCCHETGYKLILGSYLWVSLQFISQPLEITVTSTDAWFFDPKNGQICLKTMEMTFAMV